MTGAIASSVALDESALASPPPARPQTGARGAVLCVSGTFATDRVLFYSSFFPAVASGADLKVWSHGLDDPRFPTDHVVGRCFESYPLTSSLPFVLTLSRHFNNYLWDHTGLSDSRETFWTLRGHRDVPRRQRILRRAARLVTACGGEARFEAGLERALVRSAARSPLAARLKALAPSVVVAMNPWNHVQVEIVAAARGFGIPTAAFITSWDNLSTKGRLILRYDRYVVWSESMKDELLRVCPYIGDDRIHVVGAPHYDPFFKAEFQQSRDQWCREQRLDPRRPVVVYSLGSPNLIREDYGIAPFVEAVAAHPALADVQVVVRLHPGFHERGYTALPAVRKRFPDLRIQGALSDDARVAFQLPHEIANWVNTVRHADVVVNLASTMTVDASVCDRPVVNLDFDPEPGQPNQQLVEAINHQWNHFRPLTEADGFWLASTMTEAVNGVAQYLATPSLHREGRKRIVAHVSSLVDGSAGARMASAIGQLVSARAAV